MATAVAADSGERDKDIYCNATC